MSKLNKTLLSTEAGAGLLLLALFILLYIAFLGVRPLFIPDEVRYGEMAREMLTSGDWIVPRLNGLLYFEKPPFGHWMNALSLGLFGETAFAVRFASAVAAGASAVIVLVAGRVMFRTRQTAILAVFVFLTMFAVQIIGTYSILDTMFAAAVNGGIAAFAIARNAPARRRVQGLILSGILLGIAFLTKGFLAFALPVIVLVPWLLVRKQYRLLFVESWLVVFVAILVATPWSVAIYLREPDFWRYFFWVEHIQRFASDHAQHEQPFYYFIVFLPVIAFPWIFLLPAAMPALRKRDANEIKEPYRLLLALWAIVPFVFFSIARGKLVPYVLPCLLPLALLLAAGLSHFMRGRSGNNRALRYALLGMAALLGLLAIAVVYVSAFSNSLQGYSADEHGKLLIVVAALALAATGMIWLGVNRNAKHQVIGTGLAMSVVLAALPWAIPNISLQSKAPVPFLQNIQRKLPPDTVIVSNGSLVRAVSWAFKRRNIFVIDDPGESRYGLEAPDAAGRLLSGEAFSDLLRSGKKVLLVCKGMCKDDTMNRLPANATASNFGKFNAWFVPGRQ